MLCRHNGLLTVSSLFTLKCNPCNFRYCSLTVDDSLYTSLHVFTPGCLYHSGNPTAFRPFVSFFTPAVWPVTSRACL